jgi:hypothetical protein
MTGLVQWEMTVLTACSPHLTIAWTRFKIPNTICLLHDVSTSLR